MFLRELALDALKQAGLAHGENVPQDKFLESVKQVISALKYYSECDTITCFSAYRKIHLEKETLLGLPALARGIRLHFIGKVDNLPSLSDYNPNEGDIIVGRDFLAVDDGTVFGIEKEGEVYVWKVVSIDSISTTSVDVLIKDLGAIVSIFKDGEPLVDTSLSNFFQFADGVYVANIDGAGRFKVYVKEPGDYDVVYSRSFVFNENTQVDLPETQKNLVVAHAARLMAKTTERLAKLDGVVNECLKDTLSNAADDVIPTRAL